MAVITAQTIRAVDAKRILVESGWLPRHGALYAWDTKTQNRVCESIANTLAGNDWRLERLRKIEQRNGFDFGGDDCILDAGCGRAELVLAGRQLGFNIVGVELDERCLTASYAFAKCLGLSKAQCNAALHRGDVEDLPFDSGSFAVINCSQVVEHVNDPVVMARELFRCLRPGGILSLDAPDYRGIFEAHYRLVWPPFLPLHLAGVWLDAFDKPHGGIGSFSYVSLPHIRGILEAVGFEILSATTSTPKERIDIENERLRRIVGDEFLHREESVRTAAMRVQSSDLHASETSMILLAKKPESIA